MVEVFKTNIQDSQIASRVIQELQKKFPEATINFDLNDCDNILRVEHHENIAEKVIQVVENLNHYCEILID